MRIKVIIPNSSEEFLKEQVEQRKQVAADGTHIDVVCLLKGPVSIESATDEAYAAPYLVDEVKKAEKEGYDAVTIDCASDPVQRAVREVSNIPVVSAGEASRLLALILGDKFSVITVLPNTIDVIRHNVMTSQVGLRLASIRSVDIPVLELKDYAKTKKAILKESRKAIREDGADVIVLGCTGMAKLAWEIQSELKVPTIDPGSAAIKIAEILVQMKLSHSKMSFKTPPRKDVK